MDNQVLGVKAVFSHDKIEVWRGDLRILSSIETGNYEICRQGDSSNPIAYVHHPLYITYLLKGIEDDGIK